MPLATAGRRNGELDAQGFNKQKEVADPAI